jgi:hypothetical protein
MKQVDWLRKLKSGSKYTERGGHENKQCKIGFYL